MALADAVQGATRPSQVITWTHSDNTPESLTGATLTGRIIELYTGVARDIIGDLIVTDGPNGVFTWVYDDADVATVGAHEVQFTATFGSEPTPAITIVSPWTVRKAI